MSNSKDEQKLIKKYLPFLIFVVVLMLVSMIGVFKYVENVILNANIDTMRELQEHDQKAISASIEGRVSDAENLADSLASQSILSIQELHECLNAGNHQLKTKKIYLLGDNGKLYSSNGTAKEDADYAMMIEKYPEGFLDRVPSSSKKFNDGLLLIGRPNEEFSVEGISFSYIITETKLVDIAGELSTSSYNGQGYSNVIDLAGNYIVTEEGKFQENAYEELKGNATIKGETLDSYVERIINEETTAVTINHNGVDELCLTMHTPEGWILVSICPTSVFSEESNRITSLFAVLSLFFVAAVAISMLFIMRTHSRKQLEAQLKEITNLNYELEEHQAKLEETAAEQESQLEEIAELNGSLTSKQAQLESTLLDLEERNDIIHEAGYGIWKFVFNDNGEVCGLIGDDTWGELFGVDQSKMTAEECFAYYSDGLLGGAQDEAHDDYSLMREGVLKSRVFEWYHPNVGRRFFSVGGTRHITTEGEIQISGYVTDVTEEKLKQQEYEEEIIEARRAAENANAAKSTFLFNMSHDIRTPMNAIMGFRDLLEKHQDEPEKRADYLNKIEEASNVLLSIINNVLEMARIEKGTLEIDETAWSTEQFNDTLYDIFYEMMEQKGIEFTREIKVSNCYVYCDPIKLREVFFNLLSNAYKYTNPGGKVHMLLEEIPYDREGYTAFRTTITDTGIGMSEEFLPTIFDEFSRENNTTENKIEGTGLGMPIVKRLVDFMGGSIEVTSTKDEGSTFVVTIPHRIADRSELEEHAGIEIDPRLFKGKRVLLAEDNEFNAEIAIEMLEEEGFVVERAEDGAICCDVLENADENYYDIVLMDIQMPNMNGYEATKIIRGMSNTVKANIPIIAMTANAFEEDKREAFRVGMNAHIAKPVKVIELIKTLAGIVS